MTGVLSAANEMVSPHILAPSSPGARTRTHSRESVRAHTQAQRHMHLDPLALGLFLDFTSQHIDPGTNPTLIKRLIMSAEVWSACLNGVAACFAVVESTQGKSSMHLLCKALVVYL